MINMWKKIILKVLKYSGQTCFLIILIAFLAKTGNMPGVISKESTEKIVEYTDRTLIFLNLIKDERIIEKYSKKDVTKMENVLTRDEVYHVNILDRFYNLLFLNNYEINIINELNKTVKTLNQYINQQLSKLKNIVNSTFMQNIINERELNIKNEESYLLIKNVISGFKNIEGFYIFDNNDNVITGMHKQNDFNFNAVKTIKNLKNTKTFIDLFETNKATYFLYLLKKYQKNMNILFLLNPAYFNTGFNNINISYKIFLFNKSYKILNSNISDSVLIDKLDESIKNKSFKTGKDQFEIRFLKLKDINLYVGILFKKYPLVNIIMNIVKLIIFIIVLCFLYLSMKFLLKRLKIFKIKNKPSQIELVTGALVEVAKSIKTVIKASSEKTAIVDKESMEEIISNVMENYAGDDKNNDDFKVEDDLKKIKRNKKDFKGWKLIEPY